MSKLNPVDPIWVKPAEEYHSTYHILDLPDDCQIVLLKHFALEDQLSAWRVCTHWYSLRLQVTSSIHSLAIFIGTFEEPVTTFVPPQFPYQEQLVNDDGSPAYPTVRYNQWNSLTREQLTGELVDQIGDSFERLSTLELALGNLHETRLEPLCALLEQLPHHQLVTLRLWFAISAPRYYRSLDCSQFESFHLTHGFFTTLNQLASLRHLSIHTETGYLNFPSVNPDLSILGRLHSFSFSSWSPNEPTTAILLRCLARYGEANPRLSHIGFGKVNLDSNRELRQQMNYPGSGQLLARFIDHYLHCDLATDGLDHLRRQCTTFPRITSISLSLTAGEQMATQYRSILATLSTLTELTHLLVIYDCESLADVQPPEPDPPLIQLHSAKILDLVIRKTSSNQILTYLAVGVVLPRLQVLALTWNFFTGCVECGLQTATIEQLQNYQKYLDQFSQDQLRRCAGHQIRSLIQDCTIRPQIVINRVDFLHDKYPSVCALLG